MNRRLSTFLFLKQYMILIIVAIAIVISAGCGKKNSNPAIPPEPDDNCTSTPAYPTECSGKTVGYYCWYLGNMGESCEVVCATHGGYSAATCTYAGSAGGDDECLAVLNAFGVPVSNRDKQDPELHRNGVGCGYWEWSEGLRWSRETLSPTTSIARYETVYRACACKK